MSLKIEDFNPHKYKLTTEQQNNQKVLLTAVKLIETDYKKDFIVTSGVRSQADQNRINPSAPKSKHLLGAAVDISDPHGELKKFILDNKDLLGEAGLWCEDFGHTPTWVHFQCIPPKSGKRFFIP